MTLEISRQIFKNPWNIKFHETSCSGSWGAPYRQTDGRTDMMKLTVTFYLRGAELVEVKTMRTSDKSQS